MGRWADYAKGALVRLATRAEAQLRPPPLDASSSSIPGLPLYDQFLRIGGAVTPEQLSSIYLQADNGYTWMLCDLGNECRQRDGHMHGIVDQREKALGPLLLQVDPFIEPGASKPEAADVEIAERLHRALTQATGGHPVGGMKLSGFSSLKQHMQGGNYWGYAMAETAWAKRDGWIVPTGWFLHQPRRFGFRLSDGALVQWDQVGANSTQIQREVQQWEPMRWIQHQPRITGDVPAREGYGRVLNWACIFANWTLSDLLKLAELTWKPYRIGRYKQGTSRKDKDALTVALQSLTNNGIALMSETVQYELKWPEGGRGDSNNHIALLQYLDATKSKIVLHGTLLTESGDRGARSLGEVHERGFDSVVEDDAGGVCETLNRDVAEPFVRLNAGEDAGVPTIKLVTKNETDLLAFSGAMKTLTVDVGMRIGEKWAYDRVGAPVPEKDERCLGDPTEEELKAQEEAEAQAEEAPEGEQAPEDEEGDEPAEPEPTAKTEPPPPPPPKGKPAKAAKPAKPAR